MRPAEARDIGDAPDGRPVPVVWPGPAHGGNEKYLAGLQIIVASGPRWGAQARHPRARRPAIGRPGCGATLHKLRLGGSGGAGFEPDGAEVVASGEAHVGVECGGPRSAATTPGGTARECAAPGLRCRYGIPRIRPGRAELLGRRPVRPGPAGTPGGAGRVRPDRPAPGPREGQPGIRDRSQPAAASLVTRGVTQRHRIPGGPVRLGRLATLPRSRHATPPWETPAAPGRCDVRPAHARW
jgi:hypothetical protein